MDLRSQRNKAASVIYHDIFDYPLTKEELEKWQIAKGKFKKKGSKIVSKNGFYFLLGKEKIIKKRLSNQKFSKKKIQIARDAAEVLVKIPTIKMVSLTGSLAMSNASEDSDIDLMLITSSGSLWTTRLIAYLLLSLSGFTLRRAGDKDEKDKLCLNMWLDENDILFKKRNLFNAHEIAQIVPLVNKEKTYQRFIWENRWITNYWPKAVLIQNTKQETKKSGLIFEPLAYWLQKTYMKKKITRETITPTRALFHPIDWSARLENRLGQD